jgi:hypothetical protein
MVNKHSTFMNLHFYSFMYEFGRLMLSNIVTVKCTVASYKMGLAIPELYWIELAFIHIVSSGGLR